MRAWSHDGRVVARVEATTSDRGKHDVALRVGVDPILDLVRQWLESIEATQP